MSSAVLRARLARSLELARDHGFVLAMFAAALFLSALLLFSVQPIFAKMVLPKLGGSPAVWAVSMVFFQAVLLAGYAYAHLLNRHCPQRHAPLAHLLVMAIAAAALPFALPAFAEHPPTGDAYVWLIGVLAAGVGLPFFAISANAPLLQSWFARSGHPQAQDPYFLYGASNLGSLLALLAYPFAIEPAIGLVRQASLWTTGYLMLGILIAICGLMVLPATDAAKGSNSRPAAERQPLTAAQRASWIWLAAIPSGLLVSFTSYVTTDIASAPFLWVIPLAFFLATYIMVFRDRPMLPHALLLKAQPALVVMTMFGLVTSTRYGWIIGMTAGFAAFAVTTLVCHKELYDRRPASSDLTAFYMWMSLGGVLGGVFAALVAPQIFSAVYEFPVLLLAGLIVRPDLAAALEAKAQRAQALRVGGSAVVLVLLASTVVAAGMMPGAIADKLATIVVAACAVYMLLNAEKPLLQAATAAVLLTVVLALPSNMNFGDAERSFFGVHRVSTSPDGNYRMLFHGTTLHGAMRLKDDGGNAVAAPLPATYYYPGSPMARAVDVARTETGKTAGGLVVGSVGVGAGSLACYSRPNEHWRFYDIDPMVVKIANDPARFTFFSRCRPRADFELGDARLTLSKEPIGKFDYLVIDAFSSDSIPVHLLTREALELYMSRLSPRGILALHVSNRHMDLVDVAATLVRSVPGLSGVAVRDKPGTLTLDGTASNVVLVAKSADVLSQVRAWQGATPISAADRGAYAERPWTDDYSNILAAILKRQGW